MAQMPAPMTIEPIARRARLSCGRLAMASAKPEVIIAITSDSTRLQDSVAQRNLHRERQHADEVHRPDAHAHGGRAAEQPHATASRLPSATRAASLSAVYDDNHRDDDGQAHEPEVVACLHV